MKPRDWIVGAGALGLGFAALSYYLAIELGGVLRFQIAYSDPNLLLFLLLLAFSLLELGLFLLALIRFAPALPLTLLCFVAAGFVCFAGFYPILYGLFARDQLGVQLLSGLALVRWLALFFVPHERGTEK